MRILKFRAWHKAAESMLLEDKSGDVFRWLHEKQHIVIMQYTGLKDKNGKEIYEGDILKREWRDEDCLIFKVVFLDGRFGEWWNGMGKDTVADGSCLRFGSKIIGNIHESKHLLDNK